MWRRVLTKQKDIDFRMSLKPFRGFSVRLYPISTVPDPCLGAGLIRVSGVSGFVFRKKKRLSPGSFLTSLRSEGLVLDVESCLASNIFAVGLPALGECSLEKASPVFSCRSQPVASVVQQDRSKQGPHKRTGESLLCGEVHYGQESVRAPGWQLRYKVRSLGQSAAKRVGVFCFELLMFRVLSLSASPEKPSNVLLLQGRLYLVALTLLLFSLGRIAESS